MSVVTFNMTMIILEKVMLILYYKQGLYNTDSFLQASKMLQASEPKSYSEYGFEAHILRDIYSFYLI